MFSVFKSDFCCSYSVSTPALRESPCVMRARWLAFYFICHWMRKSLSRPDGQSHTSPIDPGLWSGVIRWVGLWGHLPWEGARVFSVYGWKNLHNQSGRLLERLLNCTQSSLFSFYSMVTEVFGRHWLAQLWLHFPDFPAARCGYLFKPVEYEWKGCVQLPGCTLKEKCTCVHFSLHFWNDCLFKILSCMVSPYFQVFLFWFILLFPTICNHLIIFQHILI